MRRLPTLLFCALAALPSAAGCNNDDDEKLWGGALSPTQTQSAQMGSGPEVMIDPSDGESEDPFMGNPNYPFVDEPWEQPGNSGG